MATAEHMYETYRRSLTAQGIQVDETFDQLPDEDKAAWEAVANETED